ncbi:hypothetical protein SAY86_019459 [Trapa natans]|uniref:Uncharacterized protein n=1 Tax=Trapa natans TaxID=22666 RepID=A0AAN7LY08_TRANT|nr:hypothetical protein SAY86_019459 [Trapa natans]
MWMELLVAGLPIPPQTDGQQPRQFNNVTKAQATTVSTVCTQEARLVEEISRAGNAPTALLWGSVAEIRRWRGWGK